MKWVLIWIIITGHDITSGSAEFNDEWTCEQAQLGVKAELVVNAIVKASCYPKG